MNFEEFKQTIIDEMQERFPNIEFESREVNKLQGQSYNGICMTPEGSNVGATLNIDQVFNEYQNGVSMNEIIANIQSDVEIITNRMPQIDIEALHSYEQMKESLTVQLIPISGNESQLENVPHQVIEDMAMVYRFEVERNEEGIGSILVTNSMLDTYGIDKNQLHNDAIEATVHTHPATLRNMTDVMKEMMPDMSFMLPDEPSPMWVASTIGGSNGAVAIQYPDFLDQAAEKLGGDFFVIPSSIHETLLIADDGAFQRESLEDMVRSVNGTIVAPEERLSDNIYHYDSEARIFENARTFEARMEEKENAQEEHENVMTVLLVEPNEYPKVVTMGNSLEDLQAAVGGFIEVTYPFDDNVGLVMNEEGKINGLPLNRALRDEDGEIYDVVAGPFLVVGLTEDNFGSLNQDQIRNFEDHFHQPEAFMKMGRGIMAIPIPDETIEAMKKSEKAFADREKAPKVKKPERDDH